MPTAPPRNVRSRRIHLRATQQQENLIRSGAESSGTNLTEFILESACLQAEHLLADRREFRLNPTQWREFLRALDRPPKVIPRLARLFREAEEIQSEK